MPSSFEFLAMIMPELQKITRAGTAFCDTGIANFPRHRTAGGGSAGAGRRRHGGTTDVPPRGWLATGRLGYAATQRGSGGVRGVSGRCALGAAGACVVSENKHNIAARAAATRSVACRVGNRGGQQKCCETAMPLVLCASGRYPQRDECDRDNTVVFLKCAAGPRKKSVARALYGYAGIVFVCVTRQVSRCDAR
jgi:hypothetical protein